METQHCKLSFTSNVDFSVFYHNDDYDDEDDDFDVEKKVKLKVKWNLNQMTISETKLTRSVRHERFTHTERNTQSVMARVNVSVYTEFVLHS